MGRRICPVCGAVLEKESLGVGLECEECGNVVSASAFCFDNDLSTLIFTPTDSVFEDQAKHSFFQSEQYLATDKCLSDFTGFESDLAFKKHECFGLPCCAPSILSSLDSFCGKSYPIKKGASLTDHTGSLVWAKNQKSDLLPKQNFLSERHSESLYHVSGSKSSGAALYISESGIRENLQSWSTVDSAILNHETCHLQQSIPAALQSKNRSASISTSVHASSSTQLEYSASSSYLANSTNGIARELYFNRHFLSSSTCSMQRKHRKEAETRCLITQMYNSFKIGNQSLVLGMLERIFEDKIRRCRSPFMLERLVAACCYIQGKLGGEAVTLRDIATRMELTPRRSRCVSRWVNIVCQRLHIKFLPSSEISDLLNRALSHITEILENHISAIQCDEEVHDISYGFSDSFNRDSQDQYDVSGPSVTLGNNTGAVNKIVDGIDIFSVVEQPKTTSKILGIDSFLNPMGYVKDSSRIRCAGYSIRKKHLERNKKLAQKIHNGFAEILQIAKTIWSIAVSCKLCNNLEAKKEEALNIVWRMGGSCKAALLSAVLFLTLSIYQVKVSQNIITSIFNASKSAVYRYRHALQRELSERIRCLPNCAIVPNENVIEMLHQIFLEDSLVQMLLKVQQISFVKKTEITPFMQRNAEELIKNIDSEATLEKTSLENALTKSLRFSRLSRKSAMEVMRLNGIFFERKAQRWTCKWIDANGKYHRKCFSQRLYGCDVAKQLAEKYSLTLKHCISNSEGAKD
ncbi:AP2 domain transcription factor AP2X-3 [Cardiosporidium cionae]|uniref:AP2 domain transcription factor AP2X-3 n=1 Tax=Cardiosporidium cionae TaxID=476202 RepID=A0ABQ7JDG8_9APIC|nr:AP2 domain transcription factor AP2X-3 [Cardiosporidium cionae]|eukprot:KAF8821988.1 AP2 domain transcription factor AP2X-3 [Cardiosporidium cionae]